MKSPIRFFVLTILLESGTGFAAAQSFYKEPPLFSMAPKPEKSVNTIARFGPVGMSIELHQPAFTMMVGKIEEGSPAANSALKAGQIIESINGESLKYIDPRIQLGRIIEKAEAADGALKFMIKDKPDAVAREVMVKIPALGAYSKTWPLNCPKSGKIVRNFAEYLKKPVSNKGFADIGMLFLLSTGDESDLAVVRDWARGVKGDGGIPWHIGYGGLALCEYYLRTGDKEVLPAIQARATKAIEMETFGGWASRGPLAAVTYGGGHLNAGGTMVVAYLMLAKECGAEIPDEPFQRVLAHFYRYVGKGNNPYGNNKPESGYTVKNLDPAVLVESLAATDARVRRAALEGILGDTEAKLLTEEIFARVIAMLKDPQESWYVKDAALGVVARAPVDWIVAQVDVILPYLKHEEWWLQNSALTALAPVVADKRCYGKVIPAIGELIRTNPLYNGNGPLRYGKLPENLSVASPEVQALASKEFKNAYASYVSIETRSIPALATANDKNREFLASALAGVEGGYDLLYQVAKQRDPKNPLPYQEIFLNADSSKFSPGLKKAVASIVDAKLIPGYIGSARRLLLDEAASLPSKSPSLKMDELVKLYQKSGVPDYDWLDFGPAPASMSWWLHTFDPQEKLPWDSDEARYRKVTLPAGMEQWFSNDFNPSKVGWKSGKQPIGQYNGKLGGGRGCKLDVCRCAEPVQTLWENEVLLAKGSFKFPAFREGHRYRLMVGGRSHVGGGDGFRIYVNGKQLIEKDRGVGKREGARHVGTVIDQSFWPEFQGGDVSLALIAFKNIHKGESNNHFSVWIQEMKVPPLGDKEILNSATVTPMMSSEWQAKQDPDNLELQNGDDMFRYDGKFVPNQNLPGTWTTIAVVPDIYAFNAKKPANASRAPVKALTFKDTGRSDQMMWIWSGDTLMDLHRNEALKMIVKAVEGSDYLFVESGSFGVKNQPGWKTQWFVMKRN